MPIANYQTVFFSDILSQLSGLQSLVTCSSHSVLRCACSIYLYVISEKFLFFLYDKSYKVSNELLQEMRKCFADLLLVLVDANYETTRADKNFQKSFYRT